MKSFRQADRIAFCSAALGFGAAGAVAERLGAAGAGIAVAAGCGAAAGAAGAGLGAGVAAAAGAGAGAAVAAGGGAGGAAAGAGMVSFTTLWQAADRLATFFCRQVSASLPPGDTPEQCDMKSERQFARIALCWALVIWASAALAAVIAASTRAARTASHRCMWIFSP
jgi:hypothetical protein